MIYLTPEEVIRLHEQVIRDSGGSFGVLNRGMIDSATEQLKQGFGGVEFYPTLEEKAACLGYSLASNHGFQDGNKRIGHAAMELFLVLNGFEITASVDEQERMFWTLAAHKKVAMISQSGSLGTFVHSKND